MLAANHRVTEMHRLLSYSDAADGDVCTAASFAPLPPWQATATRASPVETRKLEAEVCRRFVQVSCAKMHASRQSRSGARLYKNLLILRLLAKARNNVAVLPYECASLLRRKQHFSANQLPYDAEVELPSRKHFQQNFSITHNNNNNIDLKKTYNQNAQPNDISIEYKTKSHSAEASAGSATMAKTISGAVAAVDKDENFSMEISYINKQQTRLDNKNNRENCLWENENSTSHCTTAKSEEDARRDACADAEIASMMAAAAAAVAAQADSTDVHCSDDESERKEQTLRDDARQWSGRRLYERVSSVSIEQERVFVIDSCESRTAKTVYHERADRKPTEYRDPWRDSRLDRAGDASLFSTLSDPTTAMTFRMVHEIPSLHSVMNNSVSPPLGTINSELLSSFNAVAAATSTTTPDAAFFDDFDTEKTFVTTTDSAVCECNSNNQISSEESVVYCRKRKTSVNNPCNAVDEKRHCCEEHDHMAAGTGPEFGSHFADALALDDVDGDCCQKCGGQILRSAHATLDCDGSESMTIDNELTAMRVVPDIDATSSTRCHNTTPTFADRFGNNNNNGNNNNTHNFSAWLIDNKQFQQQHNYCYPQQQNYQQYYRYCSNTTIYGNNNTVTVNNNDSFDKNNCFMNTQQQQNRETGSGGGSPISTSVWDQVVPVGRGRGHFVGPLVGLVAETPYILMF